MFHGNDGPGSVIKFAYHVHLTKQGHIVVKWFILQVSYTLLEQRAIRVSVSAISQL